MELPYNGWAMGLLNRHRAIDTSVQKEHGWLTFITNHKGDLTLIASALFYAGSWVVLRFSAWQTAGGLARSMGEAALVGGLCDYIALKMIFEQRWYLPNSGVLPRNRQKLIDGISATIEKHWLTPQMIGAKLHELDMVRRLGRYLEDVSLESLIDRTNLVRLCQSMARNVESPQMRIFLEERLEARAPRSIRLANSLGIFTFRDLSRRITRHLREILAGLPADAELIKMLEERIHSLGEELQQRDSATREAAYRIVDTLVEHAVNAARGQIAQTVRENLMRLKDDEIREQIESRTRTHLDWIRVNGGIFGAFFGALFGIFNYLVAHGAIFAALVR